MALHPAENRGLRELYALARQLAGHWPRLADRLTGTEAVGVLEDGAAAAERLMGELAEVTPRYGLYGGPAALGVGERLSGARNLVGDRLLEKNQAMRFAVLDAQHLSTLAGYLGAVADSRDDLELAAFCRRWERAISRVERSARRCAIEMGATPDTAVEPADTGTAGRLGQRLGYAAGSVGEWVDRQAARRRD